MAKGVRGVKALLIVDILNDFVHPKGVLYVGDQVREVIGFCKELITTKRKQGDPLFFICDTHRKDDAEFELFPPHCIEGEWGNKIFEELQPEKDDYIIPKRRFSAFFGTPLDMFLREAKIEELEVVGVCTNICVLYTVASARMLGYQVKVYGQGVTSFDLDAHRFALKEMSNTLKAEVV